MNTPEFQAVEREMAPKLAAFGDQITQNAEALRAHRRGLRRAARTSGLTAEQQRLVWLDYTNFVRAGAKLDAAAKERAVGDQPAAGDALHELQPERARRRDRLRPRARAGSRPRRPAPQSLRAGAAAAAEARGHKGKWAITNTRSSMEPFLTYSDRRDLREKVWRTYFSRGDNGDANDNNAIITEILKLRAERARLLGYPTHAHWRLENTMAKTPGAGHGADGGGVDAGGRARRTRRSPTCRRSPTREGAEDHDRALGLPLLRREGAQGEVRPRPERGQAVPAAREAARGDVLGRRRAVRLPVHAARREPACRCTTPTSASGRSRTPAGKHVGLWYFDPYARPASARAPG